MQTTEIYFLRVVAVYRTMIHERKEDIREGKRIADNKALTETYQKKWLNIWKECLQNESQSCSINMN
jgi:hypothetical protein